MCDSFEGPEKKLEVEFSLSRHNATASLRTVPRAQLDEICALVHCTILSHTANDQFDSYVLSESSLFVYPHKLLIKTCGTTTLLACVDKLVAIAADIGLRPASVYYSRQRFIFPEKQLYPHTSFENETARLNALFANGESHCLGDQQGDHWFIFHADLEPEKPMSLCNDRNIEVMMRELDPAIMRLFYLETYEGGVERLRETVVAAFGVCSPIAQRVLAAGALAVDKGLVPTEVARACIRALMAIDQLYPGIVLDDHVFEPCGYSVNGMRDGTYLTMHFTPEPSHSFVSFETNCPVTQSPAVLVWLGSVLRPGRMATAVCSDCHDGIAPPVAHKLSTIDNYVRTASTHCEFFSPVNEFTSYDVKYTHLRRDISDAASRAIS